MSRAFMTRSQVRSTILSCLLLFAAWGCAQGKSREPAPPPPPPKPVYFEHVVKYSGETFAIIAAWYTGKATNWSAVQAANPDVKPERIRLGQVIRIPNELVVKREPLPRPQVRAVERPREETPPKPEPAQEPIKEETISAEEAAMKELTGALEPSPSEPAPVEPPVVEAPAAAEPVAPPATGGTLSPEDQERERLLDELLK